MCRSMCMYKWTFVGTHAHTHVLGSRGDERYEKILGHNIYCDVYFFGALCNVFIIYIFFLGFEICSNFELGGSMVWNAGSKHVEEVGNLRLEIYSSLKTGGLMVWHLSPNTPRGGIIWDFKFVQVSNWVVQRFGIWIQTRWGMIWLGGYPSLKSSGPTAWHLNPNTLGG